MMARARCSLLPAGAESVLPGGVQSTRASWMSGVSLPAARPGPVCRGTANPNASATHTAQTRAAVHRNLCSVFVRLAFFIPLYPTFSEKESPLRRICRELYNDFTQKFPHSAPCHTKALPLHRYRGQSGSSGWRQGAVQARHPQAQRSPPPDGRGRASGCSRPAPSAARAA